MSKRYEYESHDRIDGPDAARGIGPNDWRNADLTLEFKGNQILPNDHLFLSGETTEPNWSNGFWIKDAKFKRPVRLDEWLLEAGKQKRQVIGVLLARDISTHRNEED
jgi:hypothetical protein